MLFSTLSRLKALLIQLDAVDAGRQRVEVIKSSVEQADGYVQIQRSLFYTGPLHSLATMSSSSTRARDETERAAASRPICTASSSFTKQPYFQRFPRRYIEEYLGETAAPSIGGPPSRLHIDICSDLAHDLMVKVEGRLFLKPHMSHAELQRNNANSNDALLALNHAKKELEQAVLEKKQLKVSGSIVVSPGSTIL